MAAKYISRYVGRPAIAESRIIAYDSKSVTFKYKRHEDNKEVIEKVPVFEFIKKVIYKYQIRTLKWLDTLVYIQEGKEKLENILEIYEIAKGVLYGKIKPTTT
nr:transposase [Clostridium saccharobutylicum]